MVGVSITIGSITSISIGVSVISQPGISLSFGLSIGGPLSIVMVGVSITIGSITSISIGVSVISQPGISLSFGLSISGPLSIVSIGVASISVVVETRVSVGI